MKGSAVSDSSPEPEELGDISMDAKDKMAGLTALDNSEGDGQAETEEIRETSVEVTFRKNNFQSSTKLDALMKDLSGYYL
jgi:hypothetical protein